MVDFEANTGLVYSVFNMHFAKYRWIEQDLIQEGMIGLWNACNTFDESRGSKFSTYACRCIKNAMLATAQEETKHSSTVSLSSEVDSKDESLKIEDCIGKQDELEKQLLIRYVLDEAKKLGCYEVMSMKMKGMKQKQIADALGFSEVAVSEILHAAYEKIRKRLG